MSTNNKMTLLGIEFQGEKARVKLPARQKHRNYGNFYPTNTVALFYTINWIFHL